MLVLTLAIPSYTDIDSIDYLKGKGDMFAGTIVGIELGARLTQPAQEVAMPEYGLAGGETRDVSVIGECSDETTK